jgi:hypothetical protein
MALLKDRIRTSGSKHMGDVAARNGAFDVVASTYHDQGQIATK